MPLFFFASFTPHPTCVSLPDTDYLGGCPDVAHLLPRFAVDYLYGVSILTAYNGGGHMNRSSKTHPAERRRFDRASRDDTMESDDAKPSHPDQRGARHFEITRLFWNREAKRWM